MIVTRDAAPLVAPEQDSLSETRLSSAPPRAGCSESHIQTSVNLRRHAITPSDVRAALAELRQTHAASTCNHYRQALLSWTLFV